MILKADGSRSVGAERVVGIEERAGPQAQAATADAVGEIVAQSLKMQDPIVEVRTPSGGEPGPIPAAGNTIGGQRGQRVPDAGQRNPQPLRHLDERHPSQGVAGVAALITRRSTAGDQALSFVEVQRRDGDAGPGRKFAGKQFLAVHKLNNT
jgi:hypothetical protein